MAEERKFRSFREARDYYMTNPDGTLPLNEVARASEFAIFLQRGLNSWLLQGYNENLGVWSECMNVVPSTMAFETYPNLGTVTTPEERLPGGEFVKGTFASEDTRIFNKEYGEILEIDRWLIDTDQTKKIQEMPQQLGKAHARGKNVTTASFYNNGHTTAIYDTVVMFANAATGGHPNITGGAANAANINRLALGAITTANLETALLTLDLWCGLEGEVVDMDTIKLIVSTSERLTAEQILASAAYPVATWSSGVANILKGKLQLVVNKRLTAQSWYITTSIKGNVHQEFKGLELTKEADDAGESFDKRIYRYRSYEAYAQGCPDWRWGLKCA